jgi:hypothetical protein
MENGEELGLMSRYHLLRTATAGSLARPFDLWPHEALLLSQCEPAGSFTFYRPIHPQPLAEQDIRWAGGCAWQIRDADDQLVVTIADPVLHRAENYELWRRCPYTRAYDTLWGRESFRFMEGRAQVERRLPEGEGVRYRATWTRAHPAGWVPGYRMPQRAARYRFTVADVRTLRVQDVPIERLAARDPYEPGFFTCLDPSDYRPSQHRWGEGQERVAFGAQWSRCYGGIEGLRWIDNPWVWGIRTFRAE